MTRTLCNLLVVLACVSTLPACGRTTSYIPTGPSEPTPTSEPTTTIAGRVFNTLNDNPIADAAVEVVGTELKTATDGGGRYRLSGIKTTSFTVRYSHPDYPSAERNRTVQLGTQLLDLNVGLTPTTPQTIAIGGKVFNTLYNSPIVGVVVGVLGTDLKATTNDEGRWRIEGVRKGTFTVRYSHSDYIRVDSELTLFSDRLDLVARLTPTITIGGTVYGGTAQSAVLVSGALVEIIDPIENQGLKTTTDSRGRFLISGIRGSLTGTFIGKFSHPDFQTGTQTFRMDPGTVKTDYNILLPRK